MKQWRPGLQRVCARCDFFIGIKKNGLIKRHAASYPVTAEFPDVGRVFVMGTRCLGSGWPPMNIMHREIARQDRHQEEEDLRLEYGSPLG